MANNRQTPKKSNRKKSRPILFLISLLVSLAVFAIIIAVTWMLLRNRIKPPDIPGTAIPNYEDMAYIPADGEEEDLLVGGGLPAPEGFTTEDRKELFYTFLIVGLDGGINTDTIMVASYDGVNKKANIIGIPRDTLVNVKRKVKKINSAYPAGTLYGGGREGGVDQLKREVKTIIGFMPDFYVCIDLEAFEKIVDAVGGVEIDVPFAMRYDDPEQDLYINIKEGPQTLDGKNALHFARYRKGNSSGSTISVYQRMENQQIFIQAMLGKLLKPASLLKISEFIDIFTEYVYTDIKMDSILWFADQLSRVMGTDALSTYTMPTIGTSGLPMYYELLDKPAVVALINETINPYQKDIEEKDVDIINES